ncbi:MAG TPA: AAA family ATPase, partial [Acidimicrobiales bacterium]|nr:AAA family ATPase [Acidimicrobiales bacterium]
MAGEKLERALFEIRRVIAGQEEMLERVLVCLLAGGHVLIEGVPGLAKTLTIKTTAAVLGGSFGRVQFTPDLVPSDLVGTRIYRPDRADFDTELGPVFCNFLLADEINRAPAKVQSALLEVMQEHQVTIGHTTFPVPSPFLVLATQNPIESEGTYPLPEAQVDRFMLKVLVDYPAHDEELTVVARSLEPPPTLEQVLELDDLKELQRQATEVYVDPALISWAVDVATATRRPREHALDVVSEYVAFGASPRGPISLVAAARALALIRGREYVVPSDMEAL